MAARPSLRIRLAQLLAPVEQSNRNSGNRNQDKLLAGLDESRQPRAQDPNSVSKTNAKSKAEVKADFEESLRKVREEERKKRLKRADARGRRRRRRDAEIAGATEGGR